MAHQKIGRYDVIKEIGRGGMATIYAAHDPIFNRDVAIKMLPAELLHDTNFRARFQREAQIVAALEHPAIVPVYDFGEQDGKPYFVMRLMTGKSLAEKIADGPMSLDEAARIISRLAPALDEAHSRGIVHRDLKPGNILFDQHDKPYLSDFGIAKLAESGATLTGSNIVGTPAYISPEQGRGESDLDGRSDIYSLGIVLFEMLTGRVPFEADSATGQVVKHLSEPIPNILDYRSDLPEDIQEVFVRALAKRKFARFANTSEMAKALSAILEGKSLPRRGVTPTVSVLPDQPLPEVSGHESRPKTPAPSTPPRSSPRLQKALTPVKAGAVAQPVRRRASQPNYSDNKERRARISNDRDHKKKIAPIVITIAVLLLLTGVGFYAFLPGSKLQSLIFQPTGSVPSTELAFGSISDTDEPESPKQEAVVEILPTNTHTPLPSPQATSTSTPNSTPTVTEIPTSTPTITPTSEPLGPVIGGADKIAFVRENEIWVANLDGTGLRQLTQIGGIKVNPQWTPDGDFVTFVTGRCVYMVNASGESMVTTLLCATWAEYLAAFEFSPDGKKVALSLSDGLFIFEYDLNILRQIRSQDQLKATKSCITATSFQPKAVKWSNDSRKLAAVVVGVEVNRKVDIIRVMDVSECDQQPKLLDEFPGGRFTIAGNVPYIPSFGWDGEALFALNNNILNDFGEFYLYNMASFTADVVKPLGTLCCFRDFHWSPDDSFLLFGFEDTRYAKEVELYYIPFYTIGSGMEYTPIPFPDEFFIKPDEKPQPVLRPAR